MAEKKTIGLYPIGSKVWFANEGSYIEYIEILKTDETGCQCKGLDYYADGQLIKALEPKKTWRFWQHIHNSREAAIAYGGKDDV